MYLDVDQISEQTTLAQSLEHLWHLYRLKRYELAEEMLGKVLQSDPKNTEAIALLALVKLSRGRQEVALALATEALAIAPEDAYYHFILGVVQTERGDFSIAIMSLREAIRLNPSCSDYYRWLSQCYAETQQLDHAYWGILKGLQLNPDDVNSLMNYGIIKYRNNQLAEAEVIFRQVLSFDPEHALCHEYLGWMKLNENETASAEHFFTQSLRQQPESKSAQLGLQDTARLRLVVIGDKLFQQVDRWYEQLERSKEIGSKVPQTPELEAIIERDIKKYSEEPRPVTFTQSIQNGYNPFEELPLEKSEEIENDGMIAKTLLEERPIQLEESEDTENAGMSVKTQLLILKIIIGLWVFALLMAAISATK
ncbi:MAG: tetratricopeptide repeat protein [Gemmatales bacterium]